MGGLDNLGEPQFLQDKYVCEVLTFTADSPGRGALARAREGEAEGLRRSSSRTCEESCSTSFSRVPRQRVYEAYLLATSIRAPAPCQALVDTARKVGADAIAHGATGKGNDQVRFELTAYALMPDVRIIAPWREWNLTSRESMLRYADKHGIPVDFKKRSGGAPYSMDANLLHISYESGILEDPIRAEVDVTHPTCRRKGAGEASTSRSSQARRHRRRELQEDDAGRGAPS